MGISPFTLPFSFFFSFLDLCLSIECIYRPLQNLGGMGFGMIAFFLIIYIIQQRFRLLIKSIRLFREC